MDESKRLALVLGFLNSEWDRLTSNAEETAEAARNFYPVFSNIKSLEFLSNLDEMGTRGGSTSDLQEDIHNTLMSSIKKIKSKYPRKENSELLD